MKTLAAISLIFLFGCARPAIQKPAVPLPPKVKYKPRAALAEEAKTLSLLLEWTNAGPVHVFNSPNLFTWSEVTNTTLRVYIVREPAPAFYRVWEEPRVTLAWDRSSSPSVVGYKLHWGSASRNYTNVIDCGTATIWELRGLQTNTPYFFAATAYNLAFEESDYSNEATCVTPGYHVIPARIRKP
jgi:hypothetical protein